MVVYAIFGCITTAPRGKGYKYLDHKHTHLFSSGDRKSWRHEETATKPGPWISLGCCLYGFIEGECPASYLIGKSISNIWLLLSHSTLIL